MKNLIEENETTALSPNMVALLSYVSLTNFLSYLFQIAVVLKTKGTSYWMNIFYDLYYSNPSIFDKAYNKYCSKWTGIA